MPAPLDTSRLAKTLLSDDEREILTRTILEHVAGRVPVIVTTTHFGTQVCAQRSRRAQDMGAAMVMVMPPYHGATIRVGEERVYEFYARLSEAIDIPIMVQDAPASGTVLSAAFLARMAREIENLAYFKIETAGAAAKLRELIRLGGDAIEGPWDGEEAITLLPDLDAGATGAMTGGGFPDGIRQIMDAYAAGHREAARTVMAVHGFGGIDDFLQAAGVEQAFVEIVGLAVIAEVEREHRHLGELGEDPQDGHGSGDRERSDSQRHHRGEQPAEDADPPGRPGRRQKRSPCSRRCRPEYRL